MRTAVWIILRREYLTRVTTGAFWVATVAFPIVIMVGAVLPSVIAERSKVSSNRPILVVDRIGDFYPVLEAALGDTDQGRRLPMELVTSEKGSDGDVTSRLIRRAESGEIQGFVVVDASATTSDGAAVYFARNPSNVVMNERLSSIVRGAIMRYRLLRAGVPKDQIAAVSQRTRIEVRKATSDPKKQTSDSAGLFVAFGLVLGMYISLSMYGTQILRGVLEEKGSRIVEILMSSVNATELMIGKVLGVGAVGLTQVCLWSICAFVLTGPGIIIAFSIAPDRVPRLSGMAAVFLPVYFCLGYLLFATIFAAIGSMFNSEEEAQQLVVLAQVLIAAPMFFFLPVLSNPSGPLATTLSFVPFLSPTLMYLRVVTETPPMWQVALSLFLMVVSIAACVWLAAKIYRVGILMYGKRPTVPEIVRWLRYTSV